jgi:aldehyde:ferredoxin oxidoreductase
MLDEYYELRGWDGNGVPEAETVKRLEIDDFVPLGVDIAE